LIDARITMRFSSIDSINSLNLFTFQCHLHLDNLTLDTPSHSAQLRFHCGAIWFGKIALLNLLGLNDKPTFGRIFFSRKDVSEINDKERREIRLFHIGFVFQNFNLLSTLTSLENVEPPLMLAGKSLEEQRETVLIFLNLWSYCSERSSSNKLSMAKFKE